MRVLSSKAFQKKALKISPKMLALFHKKLRIFLEDPRARVLNIHDLKGEYVGHKSFNVSGDFRAIYKMLDKDTVYFVDIDNHSNLYE